MKKTATAMLTLVAGIVAASCQKEAEPDIKSFEPMTINAVSEGIGTATKTEMAYKYDILWSEDDQIYVTDGTSNDTFTLSAGEGTTKGTFTQDGEVTFNDEVQAYYPATMVQDGGLVWPATQTNNQTVPMYSTKTVSGNVEDFNFSSLGSVLQIVFTAPQSDVKLQSIEIQDGTETMSGSFAIDEDGKAIITATDKAGITLDLGEGVAVGLAAKYFNIAVPAGNYQSLTLTFTATNGAKCVMKNGKVNIDQNTVGRLTLTGKVFKPVGALAGVFSVSDTRKVYFSKGNLQATYTGSAYTWGFAADQYSYVGKAAGNTTIDEQSIGAVVDLFGWSTASTNYGISTSTEYGDYSGEFKDWGTAIDNKGTWRTLTTTEWQYLFNSRIVNGGTGAGKSYTLNIVYGGKSGLVLYPDDYDKNPIFGTVTEIPEGVVFLPAAGYRSGDHVYLVGESGFFSEFNNYWSSSANDEYSAFDISFDPAAIETDCTDYRDLGSCVRLVADVK